MLLFPGKKRTRLILPACLVVVMMWAFTFAATDHLRVDDFGETPVPGGFFSPVDYTIDCLAEDGTVISKARGHSLSSLRNSSLRIVTPLGLQNIGVFCSQFPLKIIERTNCRDIKNTILLKLRI
jgi:hypothetical protein